MGQRADRKPILVPIPDDLREKADGIVVVTCRHYGGGQIERVITARAVRIMERTERTGAVMLKSIREHEERLRREREEDKDAKSDDPIKDALAEHPPDLVCARVIRRLDSDAIRGDALIEWVDETHPDVLRHIAIAVLTEDHIIQETEHARGEGLGVSSVA